MAHSDMLMNHVSVSVEQNTRVCTCKPCGYFMNQCDTHAHAVVHPVKRIGHGHMLCFICSFSASLRHSLPCRKTGRPTHTHTYSWSPTCTEPQPAFNTTWLSVCGFTPSTSTPQAWFTHTHTHTPGWGSVGSRPPPAPQRSGSQSVWLAGCTPRSPRGSACKAEEGTRGL